MPVCSHQSRYVSDSSVIRSFQVQLIGVLPPFAHCTPKKTLFQDITLLNSPELEVKLKKSSYMGYSC